MLWFLYDLLLWLFTMMFTISFTMVFYYDICQWFLLWFVLLCAKPLQFVLALQSSAQLCKEESYSPVSPAPGTSPFIGVYFSGHTKCNIFRKKQIFLLNRFSNHYYITSLLNLNFLICQNKITDFVTSLRQRIIATLTATYQVSAIAWLLHIASKFTVMNLSTVAMTVFIDERFTLAT